MFSTGCRLLACDLGELVQSRGKGGPALSACEGMILRLSTVIARMCAGAAFQIPGTLSLTHFRARACCHVLETVDCSGPAFFISPTTHNYAPLRLLPFHSPFCRPHGEKTHMATTFGAFGKRLWL